MTAAISSTRSLPSDISAPYAMAPWRDGVVIAAADLTTGHVVVLGVGPTDRLELDLEYVTGIVACDDALVVTGAGAPDRLRAVRVDGDLPRTLDLGESGQVLRGARPLCRAGQVAVVWERYRDTGTETVAVDLVDWSAPTIAASWSHDGFSPAADVIACGDQLIDARIDPDGRGVRLAVLDEHLRPVATADLDVTASAVAVGLVGETVMVVVADAEQRIRCSQWDRSLRSIADDLIVARPVGAGISALHVVGSGERLAIAHLATTIGDATSAGLRDSRILAPPPRSTVELVTILRPGDGTIPPPIELRPPSAGPSPMCWVDERLWVLHGSGVPALSVVAP